MAPRLLILTGLTLAALALATQSASARPFTRGCPSGTNADANFRAVVQFIDTHMDAVRRLYEANHNYHARRGANRRVKRRLGRDRKLGNLWFACANTSAPLCKNASGRHAMGAASNKIRICYAKLYNQERARDGRGFCRLVELVAHEFGHAVGIKKDRVGQHSKNQNDRVYKWGREWGAYCRNNGFDRDL